MQHPRARAQLVKRAVAASAVPHVDVIVACVEEAPEGLADETSLVAKGTGADGTTANEQFALDIVNGKYRFDLGSAGGPQQTLQVADHLIAKEREAL